MIDTLPVELLHEIASYDIRVYRGLIAVPFFARSLKPGIIVDYKIHFGYSIRITKDLIEWFNNGIRHRYDGPAIIVDYKIHFGYSIRITKDLIEWFNNGIRHRLDGPAIEWINGKKEWYLNGKLHRLDGPALIHSNGQKEWYQNGVPHRDDGPAVEYPNSSEDGIKMISIYHHLM